MRKRKNPEAGQNYLEKIPARAAGIDWKTDDAGIVTLEIPNTGWANRIAQKLFHRPKISLVHLDEFGSYVWPLIDGKQDIIAIGAQVKEHFGEKAEPLYPRLAQFVKILDSYHFVSWSGEKSGDASGNK